MGTDMWFEIVKVTLLPAIGFVAGFAAQWFLQVRKSRDELVHALADERAAALQALWKITTLAPGITGRKGDEVVPAALREDLDRSVMHWYTQEGGALFLSWAATQRVFDLLDALRFDQATPVMLELAVSGLRTQLKHDCGIYTRKDAARPLVRPRAAPWPPLA